MCYKVEYETKPIAYAYYRVKARNKSVFSLKEDLTVMKRLFISLFTLTLLGSMSLASTMAYADCGSDKTQAISVIQNIKSVAAGNQAQAQAMSEQLAKLVESLSSQGCNSELLEVYRTMQREGLNGN